MPVDNDEITLKELILKTQRWCSYLFSKWLIILIIGIAGGCIGLLYAISKKTTYTGTLTFVLSNDSKSSGGLASLVGQFGLDVGGGGNGAFEGENIIELFKSRKIIKGALFKGIAGDDEILINIIGSDIGFFEAWKKDERLNKFIPFPHDVSKITPTQDSLIGVIHGFIIKSYLNISKPDKKLSFYQVSTTSPKELISVYLTKNVVDEAAAMYISTKTKTAKENVLMLKHEADSLNSKLSNTIYTSATKTDQTFNLNPALQTQRVPIQQNQVQAQVLGTAYGEVVRNLEIAKFTLQKETPLYQIIDEPQFPLIKQKVSKSQMTILGGLLGGIACILFLIAGKIYKGIMKA